MMLGLPTSGYDAWSTSLCFGTGFFYVFRPISLVVMIGDVSFLKKLSVVEINLCMPVDLQTSL